MEANSGTVGAQYTPAPDSSTEDAWTGELLSKGTQALDSWNTTESGYNVMTALRAKWGLPRVDEDWTQQQDDQFWNMHAIVGKYREYHDEVVRKLRNVAYDPSVDSIVALAQLGEPSVQYSNGVLSLSMGDTVVTSVDSKVFNGGTVGIGWGAIVLGVAISAAAAVAIYEVAEKIGQSIAATRERDRQKHAEELAKTYGPDKAKEIIDAETKHAVEVANAEGAADKDKWGALKIASVSAAIIAVLGAGVYFTYRYWPASRKTNPTKALSRKGRRGGELLNATPSNIEKHLWMGDTLNGRLQNGGYWVRLEPDGKGGAYYLVLISPSAHTYLQREHFKTIPEAAMHFSQVVGFRYGVTYHRPAAEG